MRTLLCLVVLASALAGCGGSKDPAGAGPSQPIEPNEVTEFVAWLESNGITVDAGPE